MWGGEIWSDGYFVATVDEHAIENIIREYLKNPNSNIYLFSHLNDAGYRLLQLLSSKHQEL